MFKTAIITVSDKGAAGLRKDESGPVVKEIIESEAAEFCRVEKMLILPDEPEELKHVLAKMSDSDGMDLILTTGGTGLSPRDTTPEATMQIADRMVPGIAEYMRAKSMEITHNAMLSRGVAAVRKNTLIINLPGSPKAAKENLEAILPALRHGLEILTGQSAECG
ncbi:MAG: MogA/MoaB family molybdenum cofactor biosynthesis protein [Anaerovoracaceae bacterium]|nr:MogA/MoaB family molybdenum cofactor biosynthesis protein [Anaerovoracaceae bacterium]